MSNHTHNDYTQYLVAKMPKEYDQRLDKESQFTIEISIPMRKPKGHFSRAPSVVLNILESHNGGTFFEGQGYWDGIQEPVIYILISDRGTPRLMIEKIKKNLTQLQRKLKQQAVFIKINGKTFVDSVLPSDEVNQFPNQWEFDDDLRLIAANKARRDEHFKIVFGRIAYNNKDFVEAMKLFQEALTDLRMNTSSNPAKKRDLLICSMNLLGIKTRTEFKSKYDEAEIEDLIGIMNLLLPPNSKSEFTMEVLSPHAEARMRGDRLQLNKRIDKYILSDEELVSDGIYALDQLRKHLEDGGNPYIEKDPISDLINIRKYINSTVEIEPAKVKEIISNISKENHLYADEFE
jgi:hypothetical protein